MQKVTHLVQIRKLRPGEWTGPDSDVIGTATQVVCHQHGSLLVTDFFITTFRKDKRHRSHLFISVISFPDIGSLPLGVRETGGRRGL